MARRYGPRRPNRYESPLRHMSNGTFLFIILLAAFAQTCS